MNPFHNHPLQPAIAEALAERQASAFKRYGIAVVLCALALFITLQFASLTASFPFLFFFAAVIASAGYGGLGPGLLATVLCLISADQFVLPARDTFTRSANDLTALIIFTLIALLTSSIYAARQRAERIARSEREYFRVTLASIGDAVIVTNTDGTITFMNTIAEQLTGWTQSEALGKPTREVFQIINVDTKQPVESPIERVLKEGVIVGLANHTVLIAKDGKEYPIDDSGAPIRLAGGKIIGAVLVFRDVAERQRAEAELQHSRDQIAIILRNIADGVTAQSSSGELIYANDAAARASGYTSAEAMLAAPLSETFQKYMLLDEEGAPFSLDRLPGRLALQGVENAEAIMRFREHTSGEEHWSIIRSTPIRDAQGKITQAINVFHDITEQKQTEIVRAQLLDRERIARAEAEAAKEQISRILEGITDGFLSFDQTWRFTYLNHEGARTLGHTPDELLGKNLWEEFPELEETTFGKLYRRAMQEQVVLEYEDFYPPFNAWFSVRVYPSKNGLSLYFLNISERINSEKELRVSEERYRSLVQSTSSIVWTANPEGAFITPQLAWEAYTGQGWVEQQGLGWSKMLHPEDLEKIQADWVEAIAQRTTCEIRGRVWHAASASYRYFLARMTPVLNEDQSIREWVGTVTDVHEQNLAEIERQQLLKREQEARAAAETAAQRTAQLQHVTAALSEAITPFQVAKVIAEQGMAALGANASSVRQLSPDRLMLQELYIMTASGEPLKVNLHDVATSEHMPISDAIATKMPIWLESLEDVAQIYPHIMPLMHANSYEASIVIPLIVEDQAIGVLGFSFTKARVFTPDDRAFILALGQQCAQALERSRLYEAERQARTQAESAVRLRDHFLSIAAHELKTPLTSLLGNAQLMQRRAARNNNLGEREQRTVGVIVDQASRLNRMIQALLDISRIETGQLSIEHKPVDINALAQRIVSELQPSLEKHVINLHLSNTPLLVNGDELRLEQVFLNLIQNAIKYSPEATSITLTLEQDYDSVRIAVTDQGIGIPRDALSRVFQRFYRASNADDQYISGMGIGLYVVREIVALHGGTIMVESSEGVGSTFTVTLPRINSTEALDEHRAEPV